MKNPLRKRILRDLRHNAGRYIAIFLLLLLSISMGSGFLVAGNSLITAYNESFEKYNVEWGHFTCDNRINSAQRKVLAEQTDVSFYEMFYSNRAMTNGDTLRMYPQRTGVNGVDLMQGRLPETETETAIDRMYAVNNNIAVGDVVSDGTHSWTVTGYVALSDYSSLFENNNDSMFNAEDFGVAIITQECFDSFASAEKTLCYSWMYAEAPADDGEESDMAQDLLDILNSELSLNDFVPRYQNQAINFTGDDFGGDKIMIEVMIYIIIAILAFVFTLTINTTIRNESTVIGTLLASGYTRGELVRHYMETPLLVTLIAALPGNIIGYTWMKDFVAALYYNSYSLPTYTTIWNAEAFLKTTIIPIVIMAAVSFLSLNSRLKLPPLKFLRKDLKKSQKHRAVRLNEHLPFFTRFRMRVIMQNMGSYVTLFIGILFSCLLLMFGLMMPLTMNHYVDILPDTLIAQYQYMLDAPVSLMSSEHKLSALSDMLTYESAVETDNPDAEKFSAAELNTTEGRIESITIYGVEENSRYIDMSGVDGTTAVSGAYAEKAGLSVGDTILLKDPYEEKYYKFSVDGIIPYEGGLCVFTSRDILNDAMDYGDDYFCGYFSNSEITDIDSDYLGTVITLDTLTKTSRQMMISMGGMMKILDAFAVIIFVVLMYLLGKLVIEKNAQSISMAKILGYSRGEIARLYVLPTAIVTLLELLAAVPLMSLAMIGVWNFYVATQMNGWMACYVDFKTCAEAFALGAVSYAVVSVFELRRLGKVPMDEALKNVE